MKVDTAWKAFRYGVFSSPNTGKYGPEKTLYLDTFHAVKIKQYYHIIELCWRRNFGFVLHGKICKRRVTKTLDYGIGDLTRYLPIHIMYEKLGANFCSVLLNAHILIGCNMTSKAVTKKDRYKSKYIFTGIRSNWRNKFSTTIRGAFSKGCFTYCKMYSIWWGEIQKLHR